MEPLAVPRASQPRQPRPDSPAPVIDVRGLVKIFGRGASATRALNGLDLSVAPGEVAGFLGPNGAGKSTTLRILLGMIRADGGRARLFGADPWDDAVTLHERLAYVPGDVALWPSLTGSQTLEALASLRRRPGAQGKEGARRRATLIERFDLDPSKKVRAYSKGNRQKVALIAALSEPVDLLVLDEPTSGLDPLMEEIFRQCVVEATEQGTTVLLSSHILSEVETLCDTVTIIRAGRTVEHGSLHHIRSLLRTRVHAVVEHDPHALTTLAGVHDLTSSPLGARNESRDGDAHRDVWKVDLSLDPACSPQVMSALTALSVRSLTATPPSLEELFLRHYEEDLSEPEATPGRGEGARPETAALKDGGPGATRPEGSTAHATRRAGAQDAVDPATSTEAES